LFKSVGCAMEDLVTAQLIYRSAAKASNWQSGINK
jgi:ornithine cyclodeaminase/alanine dehydrogenase-like protein (mu-crystallin family)